MSRCHQCDSRLSPNGGIESPFASHPEGTLYCRDCIATPRVAFVGCGAAKADVDDPVPAKDLYTSSYFSLKREYAETTCDDWYIVSAEHGLLSPDDEIELYDASLVPDDDSFIGDYQAGKWSVRTSQEISTALSLWTYTTTAVLLLGQNYQEHLEDWAFATIRHVETPFEDTSGLMDQMGWLRDEIDNYQPPGQAEIEDFGEGSA